jgi:hypothetical protein
VNAPFAIPSLHPSRRQVWRRFISSFRHGSRKVPWGGLDYRAWKAAQRLDNAEERRWCARSAAARPVILDEDEAHHLYTTERNQRQIARSIWAGGE